MNAVFRYPRYNLISKFKINDEATVGRRVRMKFVSIVVG